jgi:site-specific DNA-methyltransferase (adenine-specific)
MIAWVYGSGFPKSLNIGKVMDKYLKTGNASWNGTGDSSNGALGYSKLQHNQGYRPADYSNKHQNKEEITEDLAKKWEGWGTALKPALEPITVARKPLGEKTVAENCLKWGTGGINIDGGRVEIPDGDDSGWSGSYAVPPAGSATNAFGVHKFDKVVRDKPPIGRWPANFIHDGSEEVLELFPNSKSTNSIRHNNKTIGGNGKYQGGVGMDTFGHADSGSAARFFYCAKASKQDRDEGCEEIVAKTWKDQGFRDNETTHLSPRAGAGRTSLLRNNHPTVKPTSLMRYLCRLVTPPGGTILDPFMGSGSTGKAAALEGFRFIGIELEKEYTAIAEKRIMSAQPLFAGVNT